MIKDLEAFFALLFARAPKGSNVTLFALPERKARHLPPDAATLASHAAELDGRATPGAATFMMVCPTISGLTAHQKGGIEHVLQVDALWLDIDHAHPTHAAKNLPPDLEQAFSLIVEAGLPDPSILVSSGGGLQPYWLLEESLSPEAGAKALEALHERVKARAVAHGWRLDSVFNLDRVLRVPGTMNRKDPSAPRASEILHLVDTRFPLSTLVGAATRPASAPAPARPVLGPPSPSTGDAVRVAALTSADAAEQLAVTLRALAAVRSSDAPSRELARQIIAGEPLEKGQRDTDLARAAGLLSVICPEGTEAETIVEILQPTLDATMALQDDPRNPAPTREDALDKLERAIKDARRKKARERDAADAMMRGLRRAARQSARRREAAPEVEAADDEAEEEGKPYSAEELRVFAAQHGDPLQWIVQRAGSFYVLVNGEYQGPIADKDIAVNMRRTLSPAPLDLTVWERGNVRRMTTQEILFNYSTDAARVVADLTLKASRWDREARTFREACAPLRKIEPRFDPQIHEWLMHLGGDRAPELLDWIASVTRLEQPSAALYLTKHPGSGKSLLAAGLARLWGSAWTELDKVVGGWTADLARCPLVVADEHLPKEWRRNENASAELRKLVGNSTWTLTRKFLPNADLVGALRLILIANDRSMLPTDESFGANDLEAIGGRFLHIPTNKSAELYLEKIGGRRGGTRGWVDGDEIAAHALWLREERVVVSGKRFLVEGDTKGVKEDLVIDTTIGSLVCEVICRLLSDSRPMQGGVPAVRAGNGRLLVSTEGISNRWKDCVESHDVQSIQRIGRQLTLMSGHHIEHVKGTPYHVVDPAYVLRWADRYTVGDVGLIRARIAGTVLDIHEGGVKS